MFVMQTDLLDKRDNFSTDALHWSLWTYSTRTGMCSLFLDLSSTGSQIMGAPSWTGIRFKSWDQLSREPVGGAHNKALCGGFLLLIGETTPMNLWPIGAVAYFPPSLLWR